MDSSNRNQSKSSSYYGENKVKVVEQFRPKGRRERKKRQARALQNQPASVIAARHSGADAGEPTTFGKGWQQLWQYLAQSPHVHSILSQERQPGFPRHSRGRRAAVLSASTPAPQNLMLARLGPMLWPQI